MKTIKKILLLAVTSFILSACSDYLDVVPDNIATIDHAFTNRLNAEGFLFTCYAYLPDPTHYVNYPASPTASAETWITLSGWHRIGGENQYTFRIARGEQNSNSPYLNYWDGYNGGSNLFIAIRDCNIFLENIHKVPQLEEYERDRWIAEVKFLKAYYHFFLLRLYGPIPIIKDNIDVSASPEEVKVFREPVEDVVEYIVDLIDETIEDLPLKIENTMEEMGRITQPIAKAVKAQALVLLASPLFNGNPYYRNYTDKRGISLFPETEDPAKWNVAATAIKDAIDVSHEAGHSLFYYRDFFNITDSTKAKLNIRQAVTDRWNQELVWGSTKNSPSPTLQGMSAVRTIAAQTSLAAIASGLSPVLRVVEQFYSKNGVPIEEDIYYDYDNRYNIVIAPENHMYYIQPGFQLPALHLDREARFYASLTFDGCMLFGNGSTTDNPSSNTYVQMKRGDAGGVLGAEKFSITGYLPQKFVHINTTGSSTDFLQYRYAYPLIRLADLYLLYAEALNEIKETPDEDVYYWIDKVRERASLKGVRESWSNYSNRPEKPSTKNGMRDIIRRERQNELAFEGSPYWDMYRWKEAENIMNQDIYGWNIQGSDTEEYYQLTYLGTPSFTVKDYFTPLRQATLEVNDNLLQNYGWGGR